MYRADNEQLTLQLYTQPALLPGFFVLKNKLCGFFANRLLATLLFTYFRFNYTYSLLSLYLLPILTSIRWGGVINYCVSIPETSVYRGMCRNI